MKIKPGLLLVFVSLAGSLFAQQVKTVNVDKDESGNQPFMFTVSGVPFSPTKYTRVVEGSPYFSPEWMMGSVMMKNYGTSKDIFLRLDLLGNNIEYIDNSGQQLIANNPITRVWLTDSSTGELFSFAQASSISAKNVPDGWYQVLTGGTRILYKKIYKEMLETRPYGSAIFEQRILTTYEYYLHTDSTFLRIKKLKDLAEMLPGKKKELEAFIRENKLYGKEDTDYTGVLEYYRSLTKEQ